jgi:hypothetical protein
MNVLPMASGAATEATKIDMPDRIATAPAPNELRDEQLPLLLGLPVVGACVAMAAFSLRSFDSCGLVTTALIRLGIEGSTVRLRLQNRWKEAGTHSRGRGARELREVQPTQVSPQQPQQVD